MGCDNNNCGNCKDRISKDCALEKLECVIQKLVTTGSLPGISIGIWLCNELVMLRSYGQRSEDFTDKINNQTVFQAGGLSLSFLATWFARLNSQGLICFFQRIFRLGDIRFLGQDIAFHASIANSLSHEVQLGYLKFYMQVFLSVRQLPNTQLFQVLKWEATNPVQNPWNNYGFFFEAYREEYIVPNKVGQATADFLGIELINELQSLWNEIGLSDTSYGKQDFVDTDNKALPLVRCRGEWKAKYIFDGDFSISSLGLNINITDLIKFVKFVLDEGQLDDEEIVRKPAMRELLKGRCRNLLPPDSDAAAQLLRQMDRDDNVFVPQTCCPAPDQNNDWYNTMGWKVRYYEREKLHYSIGFLETGGNNVIMLAPQHNFGLAILTNSLTPYPYAIASLAYYLLVRGREREAFKQFTLSEERVCSYIELKSVNERTVPCPPSDPRVNPVGRWWNNYGRELVVFPEDGQLMFKWDIYDAVAGENLRRNFWLFYYIDKHGIERYFMINFAFSASGQHTEANGLTYSGYIKLSRVPVANDPCVLDDEGADDPCPPKNCRSRCGSKCGGCSVKCGSCRICRKCNCNECCCSISDIKCRRARYNKERQYDSSDDDISALYTTGDTSTLANQIVTQDDSECEGCTDYSYHNDQSSVITDTLSDDDDFLPINNSSNRITDVVLPTSLTQSVSQSILRSVSTPHEDDILVIRSKRN